MMFGSDRQRRAMFANIFGKNSFTRKPSSKMVRDVFESAHEPVRDFRQIVPNPGAENVRTFISDETGLESVRNRRRDVVVNEPKFPEHGYKLFTPENSGSIDEAKRQAGVVAEAITGDDGLGWVDPIWRGKELVGYTVRLKNTNTGEDMLDKDTSVYEEMIDDV